MKVNTILKIALGIGMACGVTAVVISEVAHKRNVEKEAKEPSVDLKKDISDFLENVKEEDTAVEIAKVITKMLEDMTPEINQVLCRNRLIFAGLGITSFTWLVFSALTINNMFNKAKEVSQ